MIQPCVYNLFGQQTPAFSVLQFDFILYRHDKNMGESIQNNLIIGNLVVFTVIE